MFVSEGNKGDLQTKKLGMWSEDWWPEHKSYVLINNLIEGQRNRAKLSLSHDVNVKMWKRFSRENKKRGLMNDLKLILETFASSSTKMYFH